MTGCAVADPLSDARHPCAPTGTASVRKRLAGSPAGTIGVWNRLAGSPVGTTAQNRLAGCSAGAIGVWKRLAGSSAGTTARNRLPGSPVGAGAFARTPAETAIVAAKDGQPRDGQPRDGRQGRGARRTRCSSDAVIVGFGLEQPVTPAARAAAMKSMKRPIG